MFFSLNKKFFFTILAFFLLTAGIFLIIFDGIVGKKIRAEHSSIITRNQYVIELLNENITLRNTINTLQPEEQHKTSVSLSEKQEELSKERRLNEELNQSYNESYATLSESLKIISYGAMLTILSLVILWFLIRRWVITPLDKLIALSVAVANGDFTQRLPQQKTKISDEFDTLMFTVNFMLDNIENNINEIKQKEIFLQNLIDGLPDGIRIIDNEHNITLSNKAYAEYVKNGYLFDAEKCYASYNQTADCPCSSRQYICPIKELKRSHQTNIKLIHSVNDHPLSINSARVTLNGKTAIVESIRDLSENIHYSHQQKISSLGFLATSLAHEMKNNLGAINIILTGLLQKYYSSANAPQEEKKYLEMISGQISECIKVPERLLKLSRDPEQTSDTFKMVDSIKDVLFLFDYEIKHKGIILTENLKGIRESLKGNETDFKMIILNLIQNAINAMPDGGTLEISSKKDKNQMIIKIKDSGCGIPETALKHIFEPFYSSSSTKTGTGLGLAIVKDLITKFNAKINVESKENVGTCFEIVFPR